MSEEKMQTREQMLTGMSAPESAPLTAEEMERIAFVGPHAITRKHWSALLSTARAGIAAQARAERAREGQVSVCVSAAIPTGMVIFTNGSRVVGVHMPTSGAVVPPKEFNGAHVSAANFPSGISDVRAWVDVALLQPESTSTEQKEPRA